MILIDYHCDKYHPSLGEIGLLYIYLYGMGFDLWGLYKLYYLFTFNQTQFWSEKDGGSPDARLRLARLGLARLRLNDGAKLWVSFKLCFKTNIFYRTYWRNMLRVRHTIHGNFRFPSHLLPTCFICLTCLNIDYLYVEYFSFQDF